MLTRELFLNIQSFLKAGQLEDWLTRSHTLTMMNMPAMSGGFSIERIEFRQ